MSDNGVSPAFLRRFLRQHGIDSSWTTGDVCQRIIHRATAERKCAFIELIRDERDEEGRPFVGKATVFVSHAWKYGFIDVSVATMLQFAADHPDSFFWFALSFSFSFSSSLPAFLLSPCCVEMDWLLMNGHGVQV